MRRLLCLLGHHAYYRVRPLPGGCDLLGCRRCGGFWAMNHRVEVLVRFDEELRSMYQDFLYPGDARVRGLEQYVPRAERHTSRAYWRVL